MIRPSIVKSSWLAFAITAGWLAAIAATLQAGHPRGVSVGQTQNSDVCCAYDRAEADARARLADVRARFGDVTLEAATAGNELVEALLLNGRGAAQETLTISEGTLQAAESLLGSESPALVRSIVNLGETFVAAGQYDRALVLFQRAVALSERAGPDTLECADSLDRLGSALTAADRFDAALVVLDRSLRIKEGKLAPSDAALARTLERIGYARQRKGEYEKAADPVRRAEQIRRALEPDAPEFVQTLNLVAQQLWFEGRLRDSLNASEHALALAERTLRPDHPMVARSLRLLAGTLEDLGDLERAHVLRDRALAIVERAYGPQHYETAVYLNSAAMSDLSLGNYPAARARFARAIKAFEAHFGSWHDYVATTRLNLAIVEANLGDYAEARREQARATAIWERTLGRNHPFVALALTELAVVFREQGRPAEALPLLERALAIRQRTLGADHRDVAQTRTHLAATYLRLANLGLAQQHASLALRTWQRQDEPDAPEFAAALALYGELQLRRGAIADARTYYEQALATRVRVFGRTHPAIANPQVGLALTLAAAGEIEAALTAAVEAEEVSRNHLRLMLAYLPERQSLNYAASRPKGLDLMLSLARSTPDAARLGFDEVIRSRALVLDEMAARRGGGRISDAAVPLAANLASARQRLANLVVRGPGEMPLARYVALVNEARSESELAESMFAQQSAEFRAELTRARIGLADVEMAAPPGSAVVSYVRYTRFVFPPAPTSDTPRGAGARRTHQEIPSYIALVLRAGQAPVAIPLGSARSIDALVTQWRRDVAASAALPSGSPAEPTPSRASGGRLRRLIWDPVSDYVKGAELVFIVPDGSLGLVPFAALPVGRRSFLVESGPVLHYISAERDLAVSPSPSSGPGGLLAVGAPSFDTRPTGPSRGRTVPTSDTPKAAERGEPQPCGVLQSVVFPPLEGTLREVRELSALWDAQLPSGAEAERARVLVGRQATESAFKGEAHRYRILHVATHGFFVGDDCSTPVPDTRSVGGLVPLRRNEVENPLLLSGVLLAGANRRNEAGPGEDDGVLTAEEVASLDLEGVEWAVLSACDTGVGEIRPGEGVLGLRRAFQVAGARTVVMSLWSVEDQAARAWMRSLYEGRLRTRLSTADAVRSASLAILRERRMKGQSTEPFYWAAFVAAGDWR